MTELGALLVDTSTLLSLDFSSAGWREPTFKNPILPQAIEAMVLFENINLDGPSVRLHEAELGWLMDIDNGVHVQDSTPSEIESVYLRAAELFRALDWTRLPEQSWAWDHDAKQGPNFFTWFEQITSERELAQQFHRRMSYLEWGEIERYLSHAVSDAVASAFMHPLIDTRATGQVNKIIGLVRLFYYLALQERVGGTLLLHGSRTFLGSPGWRDSTAPPTYSMLASQIFGIFSEQVQGSYLERRKRWLGSESAAVGVQFPLLAGFVQSQSEKKGWSIGRTISWLREQHEVHLFRKGFADLLERLEADDNLAVNAILEDLDLACTRWCEKLDTPARPTRRFSLQVALPFIQPATEIAVPMPARGPAEKMLVLISMVLRESISMAPNSD